MQDYKPNSNRFKNEQSTAQVKKVERVAKGRTKKKNGVSKFAETFLAEDVNTVKEYIVKDVLIPAVQKFVVDSVKNSVEMLIYGRIGKSGGTNASKASYRSYYESNDTRRAESQRYSAGFSYDDIVFDSRGDAEEVLVKMDEIIDSYGVVSVSDFYELAGVTGPYTNNSYGWKDIRNASVIRVRDGYMVKLPRAIPLK